MEQGKVRREEWTAEERDAYFSEHEPPGSYGLCWKPVVVDGHLAHCTKTLEHDGECGKD